MLIARHHAETVAAKEDQHRKNLRLGFDGVVAVAQFKALCVEPEFAERPCHAADQR